MMINKSRLFAIIKKEFIQIRRDKPSLAIAFILPFMMLFLFGYAISTDIEDIKLSVWDQSQTSSSFDLVEKFSFSGVFLLNGYIYSDEQVNTVLDDSVSKAVLVIPPDYEKRYFQEGIKEAQFLVDGSDPTVARSALNYALLISQSENLEMSNNILDARVWYNPEMKSLKYNIPGLIGLILQNITVMLTAFTLVREREKGTLEQLIVTPIKSIELMLGKLIPYILISFLDLILTIFLSVVWFKVEIQGSVLLLLSLSLVFLVAALGIGLLISTISKTQLQAMQLSLAFILPSVLLSGFLFPRDSMPIFIKLLGNLIPLTYFLEILRGIVLKGIGIESVFKQVLILVIFSLAIIVVSTKKFHKNME